MKKLFILVVLLTNFLFANDSKLVVLFESGSSELTKNNIVKINIFADYLFSNYHIDTTIEGHTDNIGSDEDNQNLSEVRANNVKVCLLNLGIHKDRIKTKSYGETKPKYKNNKKRNRKLNRRVISKNFNNQKI